MFTPRQKICFQPSTQEEVRRLEEEVRLLGKLLEFENRELEALKRRVAVHQQERQVI